MTTDLFHDKAKDWDQRPVPVQISQGVGAAMLAQLPLDEQMTIMDFGAGTGLVCAQLAPRVGRVVAVDISQAMLEQLAKKCEQHDNLDIRCQDILEQPLGQQVELVVSAMAMHHVADTRALLTTLHAHLAPDGRVALADLDTEDGDFHPPHTEGVFHAGFDRGDLGALLTEVGFEDLRFETACEVDRGGKRYPVFLVTARKG